MLLGTHSPRLDEKGRLFLPARWRDELPEGVVITKGQEHCLYAFPLEEFRRVSAGLRAAPVTAKVARDYARMLLAGASHEVPDRQGRITVPPTLRQYAGLDRECVVLGLESRIEIWNAEAWERYEREQEPEFAERAEEVLPGVF